MLFTATGSRATAFKIIIPNKAAGGSAPSGGYIRTIVKTNTVALLRGGICIF